MGAIKKCHRTRTQADHQLDSGTLGQNASGRWFANAAPRKKYPVWRVSSVCLPVWRVSSVCLPVSNFVSFFPPSSVFCCPSQALLKKKLALDLHAAAIGVSASQHARGQCVKHQWTTLTYYSPLDARDTFFSSMGAMGAMDMGHCHYIHYQSQIWNPSPCRPLPSLAVPLHLAAWWLGPHLWVRDCLEWVGVVMCCVTGLLGKTCW